MVVQLDYDNRTISIIQEVPVIDLIKFFTKHEEFQYWTIKSNYVNNLDLSPKPSNTNTFYKRSTSNIISTTV